MVQIEASNGRILRDQRGTYMYGPGWELVPSDTAPIRFSFAEMLEYWLHCEQFGTYTFRIKAR